MYLEGFRGSSEEAEWGLWGSQGLACWNSDSWLACLLETRDKYLCSPRCLSLRFSFLASAGNPTQNTMDDFTSTLILAWLPCNELTLCELDTMCAKHTTFPPKSSNDYSTGEMRSTYSSGHESQRTQMASSRLLNTDKLPAQKEKDTQCNESTNKPSMLESRSWQHFSVTSPR